MLKNISALILIVIFTNCHSEIANKEAKKEKWIAIHLLDYTNDQKLENLGKQLPELSKMGLNTIFLEIDYHFDFKSHPELKSKNEFITKVAAQKFKKLCDANNIRLIPQFQSLGHQSWGKTTYKLLTVYPELDLTPNTFPNNEGIYCREWDPYNPKVNTIVFALIDEILEAFDADGLHLGMDEVFLITSPFAKSTKDKNPANVFAKVVNDFHDYFTKQKNVELFIWGDRLIDGTKHKYGAWESSLNNTAPAIDLIPKDIIICDWHYEPRTSYSSIPMFIEKGFKVLPSSWRKKNAIDAFINYSYQVESEKMLGHLFTTWGFVDSVTKYQPLLHGLETIKNEKFYNVNFSFNYNKPQNNVKVTLMTKKKELDIYYTTDGRTPTTKSNKYTEPFTINESSIIKAASYLDTLPAGVLQSQSYSFHKGLAANISLNTPFSEKFEVINNEFALIDGLLGSNSFSDNRWLGFDASDANITLDFEKQTNINSITLSVFNDHSNWIYAPKSITFLVSTDGKNYKKIAKEEIQLSIEKTQKITLSKELKNIKQIQIIGINRPIPKPKKDAGNKTWIFIDEIQIE